MLKVIANSTPLVHLACINLMNILKDLFGEITIPGEVYSEVVMHGKGRPGAEEVKKAAWIRVKEVKDRLALSAYRSRLGAGEAACIVLARELCAGLIIMDDRLARLEAELLELRVTGTVGVLLAAARKGLVSFPEAMTKLLDSGFFLSEKEYNRIMKLWKTQRR